MPVAKRGHSVWALVFGVLAAVLTFTYLATGRAADNRRIELELESATDLVHVMVASRDLPNGTRITKDDIKWVKAVRAHLADDLVLGKAQVFGRETIADIFAGEPGKMVVATSEGYGDVGQRWIKTAVAQASGTRTHTVVL